MADIPYEPVVRDRKAERARAERKKSPRTRPRLGGD